MCGHVQSEVNFNPLGQLNGSWITPQRVRPQLRFQISFWMSSARCSATRVKCLRNCSPRKSASLCGSLSLLAFVPHDTTMCPEA